MRGAGVVKGLVVAVALATCAHHLASIRRSSINWDEFALLDRARRTDETGRIHGGGRSGLGVVALVPLVRGCDDEIAVVHAARLAWSLLTFAWIAGLFELCRRFLRARDPAGWHAAALGVASLVLVPVFMHWAPQVRTDQGALAFAIWGAVLLLASRRRVALAALAGVGIGIGWMFSQKAAYVAGLAGVVAAGDLFVDRELAWRREALRVGAAAAGGVAGVVGTGLILSWIYEPATTMSIAGGLDTFAFYRATLGTRVYDAMFPAMVAHHVVFALLTLASLAAVTGRVRRWRELVVAWAVVGLGYAVMRFHAAAFPYFWMTLGAFPAVAFALGLGPIGELVKRPPLRALGFAVVWALLLVPAVAAVRDVVEDPQAIQRDVLGFVRTDLGDRVPGFHPERAIFCRADPDPYPVFFTQQIRERFGEPDAAGKARAFVEEFRARSIGYLVDSHRLRQFPDLVRQFWADRYVLYVPGVHVAGALVHGRAGATRAFEVMVPGEYRWSAPNGGGLTVDGAPIAPGQVVRLERGVHRLVATTDVYDGRLALALPDPPRPRATYFYGASMMLEFHGERPD